MVTFSTWWMCIRDRNVIDATRTELTIEIPANATPKSTLTIKGANMDEAYKLTYLSLIHISSKR